MFFFLLTFRSFSLSISVFRPDFSIFHPFLGNLEVLQTRLAEGGWINMDLKSNLIQLFIGTNIPYVPFALTTSNPNPNRNFPKHIVTWKPIARPD